MSVIPYRPTELGHRFEQQRARRGLHFVQAARLLHIGDRELRAAVTTATPTLRPENWQALADFVGLGVTEAQALACHPAPPPSTVATPRKISVIPTLAPPWTPAFYLYSRMGLVRYHIITPPHLRDLPLLDYGRTLCAFQGTNTMASRSELMLETTTTPDGLPLCAGCYNALATIIRDSFEPGSDVARAYGCTCDGSDTWNHAPGCPLNFTPRHEAFRAKLTDKARVWLRGTQ